MPSRLPTDRISVHRLAVFVLMTVLVGALFLVAGEVTPAFLAITVLAVGFVGASVFETVRAHPLYTLASAVETALLFGLLALFVESAPFFHALFALAVVGVAVEVYNYANGTSYLRLD